MARLNVSNSVRNREREGGGGVDIKNVKRGGVQRPMEVTAGVGLVGDLFAGTS